VLAATAAGPGADGAAAPWPLTVEAVYGKRSGGCRRRRRRRQLLEAAELGRRGLLPVGGERWCQHMALSSRPRDSCSTAVTQAGTNALSLHPLHPLHPLPININTRGRGTYPRRSTPSGRRPR
jgi:hypothetical protein